TEGMLADAGSDANTAAWSSPEFTGRVIAALASDPEANERSAGEPLAGAARGAAAARRVRLRPCADRADHWQERGQRPSAGDASATPRRAAPAAHPNHARAARRAGTTVLCGRRAKAISPGWRRCSHTMSS